MSQNHCYVQKIYSSGYPAYGLRISLSYFSEMLWSKGERESAIFIGLWVPLIIGFGIYLKLINNKKND